MIYNSNVNLSFVLVLLIRSNFYTLARRNILLQAVITRLIMLIQKYF